jgi:hypothetical protein
VVCTLNADLCEHCAQMEICLNDVRQNPLKYKPLYPCDFDEAVAPRLSAMKGGRRLPLRAKGMSTLNLSERLVWPQSSLNLSISGIQVRMKEEGWDA